MPARHPDPQRRGGSKAGHSEDGNPEAVGNQRAWEQGVGEEDWPLASGSTQGGAGWVPRQGGRCPQAPRSPSTPMVEGHEATMGGEGGLPGPRALTPSTQGTLP